jgi:putative membrane protein
MEVITQERPTRPSTPSGTHPERFEVHRGVGDHFAWLRTRFALERTLMAWVRTSTALIAFGFTIVQVFERLQKEGADKPVVMPHAPRDFGLVLIAAGVVGSVIALNQYLRVIRYMWSSEFRALAGIKDKPYNSPLVAMAILIAIIGVVAFTTVLFRLS